MYIINGAIQELHKLVLTLQERIEILEKYVDVES